MASTIHVKDDFGKGPVSQVPAAWFNAVAKFINNLIGDGIEIDKHDDGTSSIIKLKGDTVGNPTDNSAANVIEDEPQESTLTFTDWSAGGDNGVKLRLYSLVEYDEDAGTHVFHPIDIAIAANGMVKSITRPLDADNKWKFGTYIGA